MQTQTPPLSKIIFPIAVALLCVILSIITWVVYHGAVPLSPGGYEVHVQLPQASDLYQGSDVRAAGVSIGRVASVRRRGDGAQATVLIDPRYVPLRTGASALLRNKTLLGEGYLELAFGPRNGTPIGEGGAIPIRNVIGQQRLGDVLQTFAPSTRRNVRSLFSGLGEALGGDAAPALNASLGYSAPVSGNLDEIAQTVANQQPSLQAVIRNGGEIFAVLGKNTGTVQAAIRAGNTILDATASQRQALAATVHDLPAFLTRLTLAADALHTASGPLTGAVDALSPVIPELAPALRQVDAVAPQFRSLFERLPAVLTAADRGLPGLRRLTGAAGSSFGEVLSAAREVIPLAQLFAVDRNTVVGGTANVASLINGTEMEEGGISAHSFGAALSFWNELPAGWVHKLPTNRQNAYPTPGSAVDIAHGGLRAYDCRNIHNPLYLPPLGTGAPPCLQQPPWTFDGVTRQYPHLTMAPP